MCIRASAMQESHSFLVGDGPEIYYYPGEGSSSNLIAPRNKSSDGLAVGTA